MSTAAIITSIVFGAANMLGYGINFGLRGRQAKENIDALIRQRDRQLEINDLQFAMDQKNAFKKADETNRETTLAEAMLGTNANIALNNLGLQQEGNTLGYNIAAIESGAAEGSGYQALAASGTRNSSAKNMVNMQAGLADKQLQLQEDIDRKQDLLTLESAVNNLASGEYNLQTRRNEAKDLKDTYSEGGDVYNLYQKKRNAFIADVGEQIAKQEKLKEWDWWGDTIGMLTSGITGATGGYGMGSDINNYVMNWKTQDLPKITKIDTNNMSFDNIGGYSNIYNG